MTAADTQCRRWSGAALLVTVLVMSLTACGTGNAGASSASGSVSAHSSATASLSRSSCKPNFAVGAIAGPLGSASPVA